jgi:serine/threonine protein kinase
MGRGGFGLVFMGPDQGAGGQWRALKTLRPELVARQPQLNSLFIDEGLTWTGLWPHANLLTAESVTEIDDRLYLVLDYAKYGSLRELLALDPSFAVRLAWAQHIAAGLVALHTSDPEMLRPHSLVHRDLKPENVLVMGNGLSVITDFGLAASVAEAVRDTPELLDLVATLAAQEDAQAQQTAGQQAKAQATRTTRYQSKRTRRGGLGTWAYMPPEQWEEETVGTPADLYAFGLILSELLAGRHGLADLEEALDEEGWYHLHKSGTPRPLRSGSAEGARRLPERVERLYERLLAKRAEQRPTAAEALAVLQQAAVDLGEQAYTVPDVFPRTDEHRMEVWHNWAVSYFRFGRDDEALERIDRAYALAPDDIDVLVWRGNILANLGLKARAAGREVEGKQRLEEALACYARGLAVVPASDTDNRRILCSMRGARLNELMRYAEAEAEYAEALRLMPDDASTWFNRANNTLHWGRTERTQGRREEARQLLATGLSYIDHAMQHAPNDPRHPQLRALIQQTLRDL